MSLIDVNSLTDSGLVSQYVVDVLGHGHFLSRDDQARITRWLSKCESADDLLLILSEILPERVEKARDRGKKVFSLASIGKAVDRRIETRIAMTGVPIFGSK